MHVFVRDLTGNTFSVDAHDVPTLQYAVCDRTGIPVDEQRLIFGGRQLTDRSFEEYGITSGSSLGLALRLRGGALKKRCACFISTTERCSSAAIRIVGDCSFCNKSYCGTHRLPEHHACANLATCKNEAFMANKAKLEAEQTHATKISGM